MVFIQQKALAGARVLDQKLAGPGRTRALHLLEHGRDGERLLDCLVPMFEELNLTELRQVLVLVDERVVCLVAAVVGPQLAHVLSKRLPDLGLGVFEARRPHGCACQLRRRHDRHSLDRRDLHQSRPAASVHESHACNNN